jgi:hypothetical protein
MYAIHYTDLGRRPVSPGFIGVKNAFQVLATLADDRVRRFPTEADALAFIAEHKRAGHYFASKFTGLAVVRV